MLTKLIRVSAKTQQRLKELGKKDETYEVIITRILRIMDLEDDCKDIFKWGPGMFVTICSKCKRKFTAHDKEQAIQCLLKHTERSDKIGSNESWLINSQNFPSVLILSLVVVLSICMVMM